MIRIHADDIEGFDVGLQEKYEHICVFFLKKGSEWEKGDYCKYREEP